MKTFKEFLESKTSTGVKCPKCESKDVVFVAEIGAPGHGQAYNCKNCGEKLVVVGSAVYAASDFKNTGEEPPWVSDSF